MHPLSTRFGYWLCLALALGVLFAPGSLSAATYIVPSDREIVHAAKAIVIATGLSSYSVEGDDGRMTYTIYHLRIDEVLKGTLHAGETIDVMQAGGCLGSRCVEFPGVPEYRAGERALVFLESDHRNRWTTWSAALGKFSFVHDVHGTKLLVRGGTEREVFGWDALGNPHVERLRDEERFLAYIRAEARGKHANGDYVVPRTDVTLAQPIRENTNGSGFNASNYVLSPRRRWKCIFDQPAGSMPGCGGNSSVTFTLFGTASGVNGSTAASAGMAAWNGESLSNVSYLVGSSVTAAPWNRNDAASSIHFDDDADTALCGGQAIGCGGATFDSSDPHIFDGSSFAEIVAGDVAIKTGFTANQTFYNQVVCHELGHTLGFRHSDEGAPSTTAAIMRAVASGSPIGAVLQSWDRDAVSTVYNPSPAGSCTRPSITTHPQNVPITQGNSTTLTVVAAGTSPFTYQWYIGNSGNTSTSIGTNSASLTVSPSTTTPYWVRVTGPCAPAADSNTATVTVTQPTCTPPSINTQPQNRTITLGNTTSLSVGAAGTGPLSYQWYIGNSGITTTPTGTNSASLQVSPPVGTTSYWVQVSGQCGSPVNSNTATITVTASTCPDVTVQTPTAVKQLDGSYVLDVVASSGGGALNYQWFIGPVPGTGTSFNIGRPITVPAPTGPTSYWVRVTNNCSKSADSAVVTIAPCDLAVINTEPSDQSIANGASATLTVGFSSASASTVRWYRGIAPDKTTEVGQGTPFNTGPLTATTQYWASITNLCGEKLTRTLTITVGTACTAPAILTSSTAQTRVKGETVTLNVNASGTATLHYQWYEGIAGDISHPVGSDAASFTSDPLTKTTKFWVNVTNDCGNAPSAAIDVTVRAPRRRAARS